MATTVLGSTADTAMVPSGATIVPLRKKDEEPVKEKDAPDAAEEVPLPQQEEPEPKLEEPAPQAEEPDAKEEAAKEAVEPEEPT